MFYGIGLEKLDNFIYFRPTEFTEGGYYGLVIYRAYYERVIGIANPWPESDGSDLLTEYLTDWILKQSILHLFVYHP